MTIAACITSISGPVLLNEERAFLHEAQPWGVILMGRSCVSKVQVRALVSEIHAALGREALIFIDQEGGRVARLKAPEWPKFPAAGFYGQLFAADERLGTEACYLGYRLMAHELASLGIHADCAPVGDLRQTTTHDAIGDRAFGYTVDAVVTLAEAALAGLAAGGVVGCIKHLPGQGRSAVDSHYDLPRVSEDKRLLEQDFSVFAGLADRSPMGMTGHVSYDALDPEIAATVSETIISEVIRGRIGFDGLLMTDDLGMNALGGSLADRGARALAAGCDVLLHCSGFLKEPDAILAEMQEIAGAAGTLSGCALARAQRAEAAIVAPDDIDIEATWQRFETLLTQAQAGA